MTVRFSTLLALAALLLAAPAAQAQADDDVSYFNQNALIDTIEERARSLSEVPEVFYDYYVVPEGQNRLEARMAVYQHVRDQQFPGQDMREVRDLVKPLVWLLNRNDLENLRPGDRLVMPTRFGLDFRAYSPFPRYYPGARDIDKLVILDKHVQAFAAYEYGALARWGIISTGNESSRTPSGRFNINWKQDYRVSTLSPGVMNPGESNELWEMYWVMNIHEARGIHMHQYALPTSGPASHGCIRLLEPDARWMYFWSDGWTKRGGAEISSVGSTVTDLGTMVLVIGEDINGPPEPFIFRERYPVLKMVRLPDNPYDVPAGTPLQSRFDRQTSSR